MITFSTPRWVGFWCRDFSHSDIHSEILKFYCKRLTLHLVDMESAPPELRNLRASEKTVQQTSTHSHVSSSQATFGQATSLKQSVWPFLRHRASRSKGALVERKVSLTADTNEKEDGGGMARRWVRYMHKGAMKPWVVPVAIGGAMWVKWAITLGSYSGAFVTFLDGTRRWRRKAGERTP